MKRQLFSFFILLIIFYSFAQSEKEKQKILSMQEAVEMAYKFRPSLKALQFNTQANVYVEKQAIAGYKPQVALNNYSFYARGTKNLQNQITLSGSQLIYSFANPIDQKKIAKKGTLISKYQEDSHKNLIRNEVENAYLNAFLEQERQNSINALNKSSKENIKSAEHKNELNLLDKNQWLIEKANYAKDESFVKFYIDEKNIAQKQLERLTGTTLFSGEDSTILKWNPQKKAHTLNNLENYINTAMENRPEIKAYQTMVEQEQLNTNYYKNTYLPSVGIQGEISRSSTIGSTAGTVVRLNKVTSNIGVNLSWNMFDGSANFHKSNETHAKKLKAMMEKESTVKQIKLDVQTAYYDLDKAIKEQNAKFVEYKQAKNEFILRKQEFEIGNISAVTFENAKTNWENKQIEWLSTEINTTVKQNNLNFVCNYSI
ncbi:MAG: TolC family protein [bacterium]